VFAAAQGRAALPKPVRGEASKQSRINVNHCFHDG
jgi:hypothetical protein